MHVAVDHMRLERVVGLDVVPDGEPDLLGVPVLERAHVAARALVLGQAGSAVHAVVVGVLAAIAALRPARGLVVPAVRNGQDQVCVAGNVLKLNQLWF